MSKTSSATAVEISFPYFLDVIFQGLLKPCYECFQARSGVSVSPRENQYALAIVLLSFVSGEGYQRIAQKWRESSPNIKKLWECAEKIRNGIAHAWAVTEEVSWLKLEREPTIGATHFFRDSKKREPEIEKRRGKGFSYLYDEVGFSQNYKRFGLEEALKHLVLLAALVPDDRTNFIFNPHVPIDGERASDSVSWRESLSFWCKKIADSNNTSARKNFSQFIKKSGLPACQ